MANFNLRNIQPAQRGAAKKQAIDEGISTNKLILKALSQYLERVKKK